MEKRIFTQNHNHSICINLNNVLLAIVKIVDEGANNSKMLNLAITSWQKQKIATYLEAV